MEFPRPSVHYAYHTRPPDGVPLLDRSELLLSQGALERLSACFGIRATSQVFKFESLPAGIYDSKRLAASALTSSLPENLHGWGNAPIPIVSAV